MLIVIRCQPNLFAAGRCFAVYFCAGAVHLINEKASSVDSAEWVSLPFGSVPGETARPDLSSPGRTAREAL